MGAWEIGNFDNDAALDTVTLLLGVELPVAFLEAAFRQVLNEDEYLDSDDCSEALVAAEVIAALAGAPTPDLPEDLQVWVEQHKSLAIDTLLPIALEALARIREDSELKDLMDDADGLSEWQAIQRKLKGRLRDAQHKRKWKKEN